MRRGAPGASGVERWKENEAGGTGLVDVERVMGFEPTTLSLGS